MLLRPTASGLGVAFMIFVFLAALPGGISKQRTVDQNAFTVIGIQIRTNNSAGDIPKQWDKFFKEGVLERIPNKTGADIVVVYSRYASDHNGDFDYLIGARVKGGSAAPPGMVALTVPQAKYALLTTEHGPVAKVVSGAWRQIWSLEEGTGLGGKRAYRAHFEVYDQRARDPNNSQVDIYVGIR